MKLLTIAITCAALAGCDDDLTSNLPDAGVIDGPPSPYCQTSAQPTDTGTYTVYLNFDGVTLTQGAEDASQNTSSVIANAGTIPPLLDGVPGRNTVIVATAAGVEQVLSPFDVAVVTTRPATGPYQMIVFGGVGTLLGVPDTPSRYLIDCASGPASQIGFVFDKGGSAETMASLAIAGIGTAASIPSTNVAQSCMCVVGTECTGSRTELCTIFQAPTALASQVICRPDGTTEEDVALAFKQAYGCRQ